MAGRLRAALLPLLASFGGDDRSTEAEFVEKGNAVCVESNTRTGCRPGVA
jgi:hypothetical protein